METIPKIPQTLVCGISLSAFTALFQKAMPAHQNFAPFNFARSAESKCAGQRKRNEKEKISGIGRTAASCAHRRAARPHFLKG
jgi:hypothetical protein